MIQDVTGIFHTLDFNPDHVGWRPRAFATQYCLVSEKVGAMLREAGEQVETCGSNLIWVRTAQCDWLRDPAFDRVLSLLESESKTDDLPTESW